MADNNTSKSHSNEEAPQDKQQIPQPEKKINNNAVLLFAIFNGLIGFSGGMVKYSINNQATSFEKHFNYEPMAITKMLYATECFNGLLFVILMGFLAKHMNIPKVTGMFGAGLGITMAMPGFLKFVKDYNPIVIPPNTVGFDMFTCNVNRTFPQMPTPDYSENFLYNMMMLGAIGNYGICTVLRWGPMSFLYFDNNVPDKRKVGIYLAISTCLSELSRPCGYWMNSYANELDPDLKKIDPRIPIGAPMFVSAWWLGPMIFGFLTTLVSIPMMFLPANLFSSSEQEKMLAEANMDAIHGIIKKESILPTIHEEEINGSRIKVFFKKFIVYLKSTKRVFKNPLYVLLFVLWGVVIIPVVGLSVVNLQYTISEYNVQPQEAEKAEAWTNFVAICLASIVSALICTRIHKKRNYLWFILVCVFLSFVLLPISFFLGCDNRPIHGLGNEFGPASDGECPCEKTPVLLGCGSDGKNYKNPCAAGCTYSSPLGVYANCENIGPGNTTHFIPMACPDDCHDQFVSFNVVYTISTFIYRMADIPKILLALRIIAPIDRGIAFSFLGLSNLISSLIGPLILVKFFNEQCVLWMTDLICIYFDRDDIRLLKTGVEFNTYLFSFIMWFVVLKLNNVMDKRTNDKIGSKKGDQVKEENEEQLTRF